MLKIAICGAGFAGAITAYGLKQMPGVEVTVFDRATPDSKGTIGAGLNMNPNAMSCLRSMFPELADALVRIGYPRRGVCAKSLGGDDLFSHSFLQDGAPHLADNVGQRLAWRDANLATRGFIKDVLQFQSEVLSVSETPDAEKPIELTIKNLSDNTVSKRSFDLLFAADGRFSKIRQTLLGPPQVWYSGVANFRVLVDDTSGSLFDDLELIYNTSASANQLPSSLQDCPAAHYAFKTTPRIAVMKVRSLGKDKLYIFGNFGVQHGQPISDSIKNAEFIRALLSPTDGKITVKSQWLIDAICERADTLHWARFQDTQEQFFTESRRVFLIGDSGKAFSPTLGLGAGAAIEQACLAVELFVSTFNELKTKSTPQQMLHVYAERLASTWRPRVNFIADISARAAMHLNPETGFTYEDEMKAWQTPESVHLDYFRRLWKGYRRGPCMTSRNLAKTEHLSSRM